MMPWALLMLSGVFEIIGVTGFERMTRGRRASGLAITLFGFGGGLTCLRLAMDAIPMAVAYVVFTGIGTVGSAILGIAFWGDSARPARLACMALVITAVIGLKSTH